MDLLKTGLKIRNTIKNMGRFREILSVFAKNGLDEFIVKSGLDQKIPDFVLPRSSSDDSIKNYPRGNWSGIIGQRMRKSFEELGPCFVKFGQLLSTREDLLPPGFISEMRLLLNQVKPLPLNEALSVVGGEDEIKQFYTHFKSIDERAIGSASIGVVFQGELLSGERVVIKLRRPGIDQQIKTDISILLFMAQILEKLGEEIKYLAPTRLVEDFIHSLESELDFNLERLNCERLRKVVGEHDHENIFHIPLVYPKLSSESVLVMEKVEGISFQNAQEILKVREEVEKKLIKGVNVFINSLLKNGFFHADLHGGNLFYQENGQIGVIDFGLTGGLGKKGRINLVAILYSLTTKNYENLVYEFLDVAEYESLPDTDELIRDIKKTLSPFVGLSVQETNLSLLLKSVVRTLARHQIYLPQDWYIVFRALMVLDGLGRSLEIDFDIYAVLETNVQKNIQEIFSKEEMMEEGAWLLRDIFSAFRSIPRHFRWFIRDFSKRKYSIDLNHLNLLESSHKLEKALIHSAMILFSGICLFSGVFLLQGKEVNSLDDIPVIVAIFWPLGILTLSKVFWERWKKK